MLRDALRLLHVVRDDHDRDLARGARRSSPRCGGSTSGRARSTARPSAARRAAPRARARCRAAAAGRPRARRPAAPSRFFTSFQRPARSQAAPRRCSVPSLRFVPLTATSLSPATTFSATVIAGNGFGFWNTMPIAAPDVGDEQVRPVDVDAVEERPCRRATRSGTSSCIRFRIRRNVDLPQPDGPMSAVTWFGSHLERDAFEHLVVAEPRADVARVASSARGSIARCGCTSATSVGSRSDRVSCVIMRDPFARGEARLMRPMWPGPRPPMMRAMTNRTSTSTSSTSAPVQRAVDLRLLREADEPVDEERQRVLLAVERVGVERRVARATVQDQRRGLADRRARCRGSPR